MEHVLAALAIGSTAYPIYHYGSMRMGVHRRRIFGALVLGLVPFVILAAGFRLGLEDVGLGPRDWGRTLLAAAGLISVALPAVILSARNPKSWEVYPQLRVEVWDDRTHLANAASWAIYLLGYELYFRGILFYLLAGLLPPFYAAGISTGLYVYAHLTKPAGETFGTIPMGLLFCAATYWTGMIWAAFFAHLFIALTSDFFTVRFRVTRPRSDSPPAAP
jgi:membrane protease YdiL (CAAX protease family)